MTSVSALNTETLLNLTENISASLIDVKDKEELREVTISQRKIDEWAENNKVEYAKSNRAFMKLQNFPLQNVVIKSLVNKIRIDTSYQGEESAKREIQKDFGSDWLYLDDELFVTSDFDQIIGVKNLTSVIHKATKTFSSLKASALFRIAQILSESKLSFMALLYAVIVEELLSVPIPDKVKPYDLDKQQVARQRNILNTKKGENGYTVSDWTEQTLSINSKTHQELLKKNNNTTKAAPVDATKATVSSKETEKLENFTKKTMETIKSLQGEIVQDFDQSINKLEQVKEHFQIEEFSTLDNETQFMNNNYFYELAQQELQINTEAASIIQQNNEMAAETYSNVYGGEVSREEIDAKMLALKENDNKRKTLLQESVNSAYTDFVKSDKKSMEVIGEVAKQMTVIKDFIEENLAAQTSLENSYNIVPALEMIMGFVNAIASHNNNLENALLRTTQVPFYYAQKMFDWSRNISQKRYVFLISAYKKFMEVMHIKFRGKTNHFESWWRNAFSELTKDMEHYVKEPMNNLTSIYNEALQNASEKASLDTRFSEMGRFITDQISGNNGLINELKKTYQENATTFQTWASGVKNDVLESWQVLMGNFNSAQEKFEKSQQEILSSVSNSVQKILKPYTEEATKLLENHKTVLLFIESSNKALTSLDTKFNQQVLKMNEVYNILKGIKDKYNDEEGIVNMISSKNRNIHQELEATNEVIRKFPEILGSYKSTLETGEEGLQKVLQSLYNDITDLKGVATTSKTSMEEAVENINSLSTKIAGVSQEAKSLNDVLSSAPENATIAVKTIEELKKKAADSLEKHEISVNQSLNNSKLKAGEIETYLTGISNTLAQNKPNDSIKSAFNQISEIDKALKEVPKNYHQRTYELSELTQNAKKSLSDIVTSMNEVNNSKSLKNFSEQSKQMNDFSTAAKTTMEGILGEINKANTNINKLNTNVQSGDTQRYNSLKDFEQAVSDNITTTGKLTTQLHTSVDEIRTKLEGMLNLNVNNQVKESIDKIELAAQNYIKQFENKLAQIESKSQPSLQKNEIISLNNMAENIKKQSTLIEQLTQKIQENESDDEMEDEADEVENSLEIDTETLKKNITEVFNEGIASLKRSQLTKDDIKEVFKDLKIQTNINDFTESLKKNQETIAKTFNELKNHSLSGSEEDKTMIEQIRTWKEEIKEMIETTVNQSNSNGNFGERGNGGGRGWEGNKRDRDDDGNNNTERMKDKEILKDQSEIIEELYAVINLLSNKIGVFISDAVEGFTTVSDTAWNYPTNNIWKEYSTEGIEKFREQYVNGTNQFFERIIGKYKRLESKHFEYGTKVKKRLEQNEEILRKKLKK